MRILVADDSIVYRELLRSLLEQWGYEVVLAADGNEASTMLEGEDVPRLAILDCVMPGLSGLELCKLIRQRKQTYVYTILLSADGEQGAVMRGFELGADDYLRKPFEELELRARLKVGERIMRTHEELVAARESLRFEATHDAMTRLWNRAAIIDLLGRELNRAQRLDAPLSVFLADIDFFKRINDTYGHVMGDEVLRNVATRMGQALRGYDLLGRYGGEEFLVVLPDCTAEAAVGVAERVRRSVSDEAVLNTPSPIGVTLSVGVGEWRAGQDATELLRETDAALYRAKHAGRNRVAAASGVASASRDSQ